MSKCFLFVEEEIVLSAMCGNASFFVIWFAKRCFCAGVQYFWVAHTGLLLTCGRSCSHSRMVFFWSYSRRLSLHNHAVVCLPEQAISFERQTGGNSSLQGAICCGFPFGCKDRSFRANVCAEKEAEERESEESKKAERDALHGVLLNVWRKYARPPLARRCGL